MKQGQRQTSSLSKDLLRQSLSHTIASARDDDHLYSNDSTRLPQLAYILATSHSPNDNTKVSTDAATVTSICT